MTSYDIAIIGAGPGGYVAAIRAAQLGKKVALIEKGDAGGVCLNRGCIPTKALIASAHAFSNAKNSGEFGISVSSPAVDMKKVRERKDKIVKTLRDGIEKLIKTNGIDLMRGTASFTGPKKLAVDGKELDAKNILIASGSSWINLPNLKIDGRIILTSDEALNFEDAPARIAIVGGGVVGCEFACMMGAFGSKVTVIEAMPSILPMIEKSVSRLLARSMKGQGIEILTDTTVTAASIKGNEAVLTLSSGKEIFADKVLVAVGRRPNTDQLNLNLAGVATDERGFIKVDERFRTTAENICAIGDCIGNPMLAHAASAEGIAAVEGIFGKAIEYDPKSCPSPIFTIPEIASVGLTSEELERDGIEFKTGRFPYAANGKALCDGETEGQAIVHADANGKILGVHIFGKDATILIAEAAVAIKNGLTVSELAHTIHAHPTLSEIVCEAAENSEGRAIHKISRA